MGGARETMTGTSEKTKKKTASGLAANSKLGAKRREATNLSESRRNRVLHLSLLKSSQKRMIQSREHP